MKGQLAWARRPTAAPAASASAARSASSSISKSVVSPSGSGLASISESKGRHPGISSIDETKYRPRAAGKHGETTAPAEGGMPTGIVPLPRKPILRLLPNGGSIQPDPIPAIRARFAAFTQPTSSQQKQLHHAPAGAALGASGVGIASVPMASVPMASVHMASVSMAAESGAAAESDTITSSMGPTEHSAPSQEPSALSQGPAALTQLAMAQLPHEVSTTSAAIEAIMNLAESDP